MRILSYLAHEGAEEAQVVHVVTHETQNSTPQKALEIRLFTIFITFRTIRERGDAIVHSITPAALSQYFVDSM